MPETLLPNLADFVFGNSETSPENLNGYFCYKNRNSVIKIKLLVLKNFLV